MEANRVARCTCVSRHAPPVVVTDLHHIVPQSWGGKTEPSNMIELCPSTHYTVHALLNEYVRAMPGKPTAEILAKYPLFARKIALQAVTNVGTVPHIFTQHYRTFVEGINEPLNKEIT